MRKLFKAMESQGYAMHRRRGEGRSTGRDTGGSRKKNDGIIEMTKIVKGKGKGKGKGKDGSTPRRARAGAGASTIVSRQVGGPMAAAARFFSALSDQAFFTGEQVQHLYMYGEINDVALVKLRADVDAAARGQTTAEGVEVAPRPIVLHVNSPGGDMFAGISMMSVFNECRVPICVCIDGLAASAATFVSVLAPYRVMTPLAMSLVHEYFTVNMGKASDLRFRIETADSGFSVAREMYLRRTRLTPSQLDSLLSRDLLLPATVCAEYGICDRVLTGLLPNSGTAAASRGRPASSRPPLPPPPTMPLSVALRKTNLNHVRFVCTGDPYAPGAVEQLDALLHAGHDLKPVVVHSDGLGCLTDVPSQLAPVIARLAALSAPTYGVVDTQVSLDNFLPVLLCSHRVMYAHASVVIHMVYRREFAWLLEDLVVNTRQVLDAVRHLLRTRTRLPADIVDNIHARRTLLSARDCLRYGMVDEIVSVQ